MDLLSIQKICRKFPLDLSKIKIKKSKESASERFYFSFYQIIEQEKNWEEKYDEKGWIEKKKLKLKNMLNKEKSDEKYRTSAVKNNNICEDYDKFKQRILSLLEIEDYKGAGKIAENQLSKYSSFKPYLKKYNTDEHQKVIFPKEEIALTISPDYSDGWIFYEFKLTEKKENITERLKEGICQVVFYSVLDYYLMSSFREKILKKIKRYPIIVEIYIVNDNEIIAYLIDISHNEQVKLFEGICEWYKKETNIDLNKLVKEKDYFLE